MQGFIIWKFLLIGIFTTNLFGQSRNIKHSSYDQGPHTEIFKDGRYQKIHFVSGNGSDQIGNGSKEDPWQSISFALQMIKDASESNRIAVLVAEGSNQDSTLTLKPFIDLYGGYSVLDWRRNILKYPTGLTGRNKFRIIIASNDTRLDGFIISRGVVRGKGAAILCDNVSPVISNNIFTQNKTLSPDPWEPELRHETANDGGAICVLNTAAPIIENNLFYENSTDAGRGAAIALNNHCGGKIANNVFLYNKAGLDDPKRSSDGGAISIFEWSNPLIENNIILENHALAKNDGGAIFSSYWSSPQIHNNIFVGNYADDDGGAIFTGGQNHHDEIPPQFDSIPGEGEFFIQITDNKFFGNNQALEFSMESRGLFANNIVAHNGDLRTYPTGVYFQRSEARIINNTILDPFLINFKTFDNKPHSDGLKPSVLQNNSLFGSFEVKTEIIQKNNYIRGNSGASNSEVPQLMNKWYQFNSDAVYPGLHLRRQIYTTKIFLYSANFNPNQFVNRIIRSAEHWAVVKSNDEQMIEVWGDLVGHISFDILPTYQVK